MYITPSDTTPSGTYLLSVVAQAGSTVRAIAVELIVTRTGDFGLSLAPSTVSVPAGNDAVSAINVLKVGATSIKLTPAAIEMKSLSIKIDAKTALSASGGLTTDLKAGLSFTINGMIVMIN